MYKLISSERVNTELLEDFFEEGQIGLHVTEYGLGIHVTEETMRILEQVGYVGEPMQLMPPLRDKKPSPFKDWFIVRLVTLTCLVVNGFLTRKWLFRKKVTH